MHDLGRLWVSNNDVDNGVCPKTPDAIPISDCHEWDGLFSIHARDADREVQLTAWCNGNGAGNFKLKRKGYEDIAGKTRVVHAPQLMEPDGYAFPAGSYFGAGLWTVECEPENGPAILIKIEVRDWNSTD